MALWMSGTGCRFQLNSTWLTRTLFPLQRCLQHINFVHKVTAEPIQQITWVDSRLAIWTAQVQSRLNDSQKSSPVDCLRTDDCVHTLNENVELNAALDTLFRMDQQGSVPSVEMYRSLLRTCTKRKALTQARRVHAHLAKHGLESTRFLGESVVKTLVKCGSLEDALYVFCRLQQRTVVSWTAVISGYTDTGQCQAALIMYQRMQEEGVQPNSYTFVSLLRACGSISDLETGKVIHAEALKYRLESDVFVGTCLVDMYARCGNIMAAQNVFDRLPHRNVVSWNALISAYAQQGQAEKVLQLYEQMQEVGVSRDVWTFVRVLQACSMLAENEEDGLISIKVKALEMGKAIHADSQKMGCDSDSFVANSLISMYSKCGSIAAAQVVFERFHKRDVVSWTAMLAALVHEGQLEKALQLYEQMWVEGINPNNRTFVSVLQACGMLAEKEDIVDGQSTKTKHLQKGRVIHADAWKKGYDSDVFVGNTLISMYGKCGAVVDSQEVFNGFSRHDVVSWNAMLTSYVEQGETENALKLYEQMRHEGVSPDAQTFYNLLRAHRVLAENENAVQVDGWITKVNCLKNAKVIHADAQRKGHHSDVFVGILLIVVYRKCGFIVEARFVFDGLHSPDVVSWNAMLAAYCQDGQPEKALQLYERMIQENVCPDARTFVSTLQACGMFAEMEDLLVDGLSLKVKSLEKAKAIHAAACRNDYVSDVFVGSILISTYGKCGSIVDAKNVFDRLSKRDVVAWNVMLAAYVEQDQGEAALHLYREMQQEGGSPNETTLVCIMQACSSTGSLTFLKQIHHILVSTKRDSSPLVANTLVGAYGRCASMVDAQIVFDALPNPDVVSWTALIAGYARQGNYAVTLQQYEKMQLAGIKPDGVTFLSLLSTCSHTGLVDQGVEYFNSMTRDYGIIPDIDHYVSLVNLFGGAGCFTPIKDLLSTMPLEPNLDIWLCLLGACQKHGKVVLGEEAFNHAVSLQPRNSSAYALMSNIYYDAGLWDYGDKLHQLRLEERACKTAGQSWIESEQEVHSFAVGDGKHRHHRQLYDLVCTISLKLKYEGQILQMHYV